jgi:hypothetical protein
MNKAEQLVKLLIEKNIQFLLQKVAQVEKWQQE